MPAASLVQPVNRRPNLIAGAETPIWERRGNRVSLDWARDRAATGPVRPMAATTVSKRISFFSAFQLGAETARSIRLADPFAGFNARMYSTIAAICASLKALLLRCRARAAFPALRPAPAPGPPAAPACSPRRTGRSCFAARSRRRTCRERSGCRCAGTRHS
jgi:hypothetical protein